MNKDLSLDELYKEQKVGKSKISLVEPKSSEITVLVNGDVVWEDSIWYFSDKNKIYTNFDDPLNIRYIFDKDGKLKSVTMLDIEDVKFRDMVE